MSTNVHTGFKSAQKAVSYGPSGSGIKIKPSRKGLLHEKLGVPKGQKIPSAKLRAAKNSSSPALRKEANFAINAKKFKH